jgi:hypothetical protein
MQTNKRRRASVQIRDVLSIRFQLELVVMRGKLVMAAAAAVVLVSVWGLGQPHVVTSGAQPSAKVGPVTDSNGRMTSGSPIQPTQ